MKTSLGWRNSKKFCHLPPVGIRASANSPGIGGALSRRLLPSELQHLQLLRWELPNLFSPLSRKFKVLNDRGNFRGPKDVTLDAALVAHGYAACARALAQPGARLQAGHLFPLSQEHRMPFTVEICEAERA
jgi:hypothetical protein